MRKAKTTRIPGGRLGEVMKIKELYRREQEKKEDATWRK